jgi:Tfp pilus assembly protein PilX
MKVKENGFLMITVIILIFILGFLTVAISYLVVSESSATLNQYYASQSFYAAESGLNYATYYLTHTKTINNGTRLSCGNLNGFSAYINSGVSPSDQFILSTANAYGASQLSGAISDTATSLSVNNGSFFTANGGRVIIDREAINYAKINGSILENLNRGVDGTIPAAHPINAVVSQDQCIVASSGYMPSSASPNSLSVLQESTQLEYGLIGGLGGHFAQWDGSLWTRGADLGTPLKGLTMLSAHDAIAVGNVKDEYPVVFRWNGSSFSREGSTAQLGNMALNSISCSSHSNCWAVGKIASRNESTIVRYNGVWSKINPNFAAGNVDIFGISCPNNSECIAVGAEGATYRLAGGVWSRIANAGAKKLNSVDCPAGDLNNCWTAGLNMKIFYRFNASTNTWTSTADIFPQVTFLSIFCLKDMNDPGCFATNINGDVYFNSTPTSPSGLNNWTLIGTGVCGGSGINANAIACYNTKNCWVTCNQTERVSHYDGAAWTTFSVPGDASPTFTPIALIGPNSNPHSNWKGI